MAAKDDEAKMRAMLAATHIAPEYVMARFETEHLPALIHAATTPPEGKKTASTKAARELCAAVAYCLEHDIPMLAPLRAWLVVGMKAGVAGTSVDAALKLNRGAGQSKDPTDVAQHEREIAVWIFGKLNREGLSEAQAKESACAKFGLDTRRIEQIWQRYKPSKAGLDAMKEWKSGMADLVKREPQDRSGAAHRDWTMEVIEHSKRLL